MVYNGIYWYIGYILWKDPPFLMGKFTISMAIFNSYVSLPEGIINSWRIYIFIYILYYCYYYEYHHIEKITHSGRFTSSLPCPELSVSPSRGV